MAKNKTCQYCYSSLSKNEIGLSKKMFEMEARQKRFTCLSCMADVLETTIEDLENKIEEFKNEGCKLFS